jgi:periplasmic protein TonB
MLNHRAESKTPESPRESAVRVTRLEILRSDSFLTRLCSNFKDFLASRPLRNPLTRSHQPTSLSALWASDVWREGPQFARVEALSITIHVTILVLLIMPLLPRIGAPSITKTPIVIESTRDLAAFLKHLSATESAPVANKPHGGGGGGDHNPLTEGKGTIALFNRVQLVPPSVKSPSNPIYPVHPTILGPEELKLLGPNMSNWGNPVSTIINDSNGPGSRNGIGTGDGHGIGPGNGDGFGPGNGQGIGDGSPISGVNGYSEVACIYCPAAQFTDEAVKAKFEGTVLLSVVVTADGRATDVRVVRGLGMGLDEQARDAVRKWRFRPSVGPEGKAASVRAIVEVIFHLF